MHYQQGAGAPTTFVVLARGPARARRSMLGMVGQDHLRNIMLTEKLGNKLTSHGCQTIKATTRAKGSTSGGIAKTTASGPEKATLNR